MSDNNTVSVGIRFGAERGEHAMRVVLVRGKGYEETLIKTSEHDISDKELIVRTVVAMMAELAGLVVNP